MSREPKTFDKAAFGYKPDEVDRYIAELHQQIAALEAEKAQQQAKMKILADKITEYRSDEGAIKDTLLEAQRMKSAIESEAKAHAEQVVAEAESRAQQLKNEAKSHATRLLSEAKNRSSQMVADAQRQADEAVGAVRGQVEREKRTLSRIQHEVATFKSTLTSIYRAHIKLITSLPDEESKDSAQDASASGANASGASAAEANAVGASASGAAVGKQAAEGAEDPPAPQAASEKETADESNGQLSASDSAEPAAPDSADDAAAQQAAFTQRFGEVKLESGV